MNRSECKNLPRNTLSRSLCVTPPLHWLQLSVCFSGGWGLTELWARPRSSRAALSHSLRCLETLSQSQLAIPAGVTPSPANHRPRQSGKGEGLIKRSDSDTLIHALMRSIDRGETWPVSHEHQWSVDWGQAGGAQWVSVCQGWGQLSPILSLSPSVTSLQCAACCRPLQCRMVSWRHPPVNTPPPPLWVQVCGLQEVQICKNIQFYDLKYISLGCTEPAPFTPHTRHRAASKDLGLLQNCTS